MNSTPSSPTPSSVVSLAGANDAAAPRIEPHVRRVAIVVILGAIMSVLDTTIVNVALPDLSIDLHSSLSGIQWVVTGYLLSLAAVIPVTGWAVRRYSARRLYLIALVVFTVGSALCAFATNSGELIAFRVLQGIGGGMLTPIGQMILVKAAGPRNLPKVMSLIGIPIVLAPVFGPTLGGLLLQSVGWQWIFMINVPIGVLALTMAWRLLPHDSAGTDQAGRLDVVGLGLAATGVVGLTYGLSESGPPRLLVRARPRPRRPGPARAVRGSLAADRASVARSQPARQPGLPVGGDRDLLSRRGAVRRNDPDAALLPDDPRRGRDHDRHSADPAGHRRRARHVSIRAPERALWRRTHLVLRRHAPRGGHGPVRARHRHHALRHNRHRHDLPRHRHRPVDHARDDRRLLGPPSREGQRREPAADRAPAGRRIAWNRDLRGRPPEPDQRRSHRGRRGRRVRADLLVGDGRHSAGADPDAAVGADRATGQGDCDRGPAPTP